MCETWLLVSMGGGRVGVAAPGVVAALLTPAWHSPMTGAVRTHMQ